MLPSSLEMSLEETPSRWKYLGTFLVKYTLWAWSEDPDYDKVIADQSIILNSELMFFIATVDRC
jgi:hypothetical protein